LQGEGQEFESPRLHHPLRQGGGHNRRSRDHPRQRRSNGSPFGPAIEPLIRVLPPAGRPPTSGSLGTIESHPIVEVHLGGPHLNNWIVFGRNEESSISPSSQGNDPDRSRPSTDRLVRGWRGSSYKGHGVDALAPRADEGRGRLRKASGSREQTVIRRCPNGETRLGSCPVTPG
jgi:hypothetical protein